MKRVLISTVYNEAASIGRWIDALQAQTVQPDEFVVVDGGSSDNTVDLLRQGFKNKNFPQPVIIVQRCNIAEGRNLAIRNSTLEIVASVDAGSIPDPCWLEEVTRPFQENPKIGVVGGYCPMVVNNDLQRTVSRLNKSATETPTGAADISPSSRNVAFTREAWTAVGGYPEWLTLTAEDALFNANLHAVGIRFYYQPSAIVTWEMRPTLASYLKMMCSYGYGSAEMGQGTHLYRNWLLTTLLPPLILFSPHPLSDAPLRYLRNAASSLGWLKGHIQGRKAPGNWGFVDGVWLSPQALATIEAHGGRSAVASSR
jgi:cellulose synthase/poly-beta-1,6-N-acetylglucosamine synthase-like glycosyltransferase